MGDIVPFALAADAHDARPDGGHGPFAPAADAHDTRWGTLFLLPWQLMLMMRGLMGDMVLFAPAADAHDGTLFLLPWQLMLMMRGLMGDMVLLPRQLMLMMLDGGHCSFCPGS